MKELHDRFAHANIPALQRLLRIHPSLRSLVGTQRGRVTCTPYSEGKLTRQPHAPQQRATDAMQKMSAYTADPFIYGPHGNRYLTVAVDDSTGYTSPIFTRTKSQAGTALVELLKNLQRLTGHQLKRIHSVGAGELFVGHPARYASENGISVTKTGLNSP